MTNEQNRGQEGKNAKAAKIRGLFSWSVHSLCEFPQTHSQETSRLHPQKSRKFVASNKVPLHKSPS